MGASRLFPWFPRGRATPTTPLWIRQCPGDVILDKTTGVSYNAFGVRGRKYLLPAMWDPQTSACKTLV
ncbi:hypothetical protein C1H46_016551 [Malus baccata]|uniref:Uncharacterized protein n=1 Tax=Malus baccata TaxID=106549 RepID=A0A540MGI3_MALBA|nr:hypothetical protein C1H46_016551 [Malus baccata]